MVELNNQELHQITGGGWGILFAIISGITFIIGVFDGYTRPLSCR